MPGPSTLNIPEQQVGAICYLYGITNNGSAVTIAEISSFEFDSDDVSVVWDEKSNKDTTGNIQNYTQTNFRYERSLKVFPSGATRAAAATIAGSILASGSSPVVTIYKLTIANYKVTEFNGVWRIKSGTKVNLKMDDNATMDFSIEQFLNSAQNAAMTGAPISG